MRYDYKSINIKRKVLRLIKNNWVNIVSGVAIEHTVGDVFLVRSGTKRELLLNSPKNWSN